MGRETVNPASMTLVRGERVMVRLAKAMPSTHRANRTLGAALPTRGGRMWM